MKTRARKKPLQPSNKISDVPIEPQVLPESLLLPPPIPAMPQQEQLPQHVIASRNWKEYVGESLLIIFSVLLALFVSESVGRLHEESNTKMYLHNIAAELQHNKQAIQELQAYNTLVLNKIDTVLAQKPLQKALVNKHEFHLELIAPNGILFRYLEHDAWTIARNNGIMSKIDFETVALLTKIYEDQDRVHKVEDEAAAIIFSRESRESREVPRTLVLLRDAYRAWAVDRLPVLQQRIDKALDVLKADTVVPAL